MATPNESMFPELPDVTGLTDDQLTDLFEQYTTIIDLATSKDEDTLGDRTAEQIKAELNAGIEALEAIKAEQQARADAEAKFEQVLAESRTRAGLTDPTAEEPEGDPDDPAEPTEDEPAESAVSEEALESVLATSKPVRRAPLPAARRHRPQAAPAQNDAALIASSFVNGIADPGDILDARRLAEVQSDMINKKRINPGQRVVIASASFQFPEDRILTGNGMINSSLIDAVIAPRALVASGGLCAPLTPIYSMPDVETADRPVRDALAGFQATRGGVIVPENPILTDYADAVGSVTAADDELGGTFAVKNCMRIECPDFNSVEVDSIYRCIEVGNLTGKAYPELLSRVDTLVMANHARLAEGIILGAIKGGSTAVTDVNTTSTAGAVWKFLGYLGASVAGMRSRNRMSDSARIRGLFPFWLPEAIQTDLGRSQAPRDYAEAEARAIFGRLGINATFYKDDALISDGAGHLAPTGTSQIFAAQTGGNLLPYPTAVQYALYPEGAWLHLDSGSLDLGIVRDSTLNSTNDYQVFAETWEQAALIGVESQWHTATLSFNGTFSLGKDFSASTTF